MAGKSDRGRQCFWNNKFQNNFHQSGFSSGDIMILSAVSRIIFDVFAIDKPDFQNPGHTFLSIFSFLS